MPKEIELTCTDPKVSLEWQILCFKCPTGEYAVGLSMKCEQLTT